MAAPRQMTARTLNALKGWPQQAAVDFEAKLDSSLSAVVPPGAVVHVDPTSLCFKLGVGNTFKMPLFTFNGSDDPDVVNEGGDPATEKNVFIAINPGSSNVSDRSGRGAMMALVAVGAYELVSTNFTAGQYAVNQPLTASLGTDPTTNGKLVGGTYPTDTIVGVVSRGVVDNGYGSDALAFWPVFLPAHTH